MQILFNPLSNLGISPSHGTWGYRDNLPYRIQSHAFSFLPTRLSTAQWISVYLYFVKTLPLYEL